MDTVSFVLSLIALLALALLALSALTLRLWYALRCAQSELVRQDAQSRPRSPQNHAAGYDTGLIER